jgi:hypothetical protein
MYIQTIDYNIEKRKKEKKQRMPISKSKKIGTLGTKIKVSEPIRQTTTSFDNAAKRMVKTNWVDRMDKDGDIKLVPQEH